MAIQAQLCCKVTHLTFDPNLLLSSAAIWMEGQRLVDLPFTRKPKIVHCHVVCASRFPIQQLLWCAVFPLATAHRRGYPTSQARFLNIVWRKWAECLLLCFEPLKCLGWLAISTFVLTAWEQASRVHGRPFSTGIRRGTSSECTCISSSPIAQSALQSFVFLMAFASSNKVVLDPGARCKSWHF